MNCDWCYPLLPPMCRALRYERGTEVFGWARWWGGKQSSCCRALGDSDLFESEAVSQGIRELIDSRLRALIQAESEAELGDAPGEAPGEAPGGARGAGGGENAVF